jgi:glycosyltransferase involved in cell wall biosynthesis
MKVLLINKFLYPKGGDAIATLATGDILSRHGHEVFYWGMAHPDNPPYPFQDDFAHNIDYNQSTGLSRQLRDACTVLYSFEARKKLGRFLSRVRPDIVHVHNFAHQLSPSILDAAEEHSIPVVMTMHDYKLVCPVYTLLSGDKICERCSQGRWYNCLLRKCTKGSRSKSLINTLEMYLHHDLLKIYRKIRLFIAPSRFMLAKVAEMGFPGEVVHVPNAISTDEYQPTVADKDGAVLYIGRLSHEKGLQTLLDAVARTQIRLKIIGDGPQRDILIRKTRKDRISNVEFMGYQQRDVLKEELKHALCVVQPSEWYENNPLSVLEAFASGKPVVGARIGGIPELIKDGVTGFTFTSGNAHDLRDKLTVLTGDVDQAREMGRFARTFVEREFSPNGYYRTLLDIYARVIAQLGCK